MAGKRIRLLVDGHLFDGIFQGTRTFIKGLYSELAASDRLEIHVAANDTANLRREFASARGPLRFIELNSSSRLHRLIYRFPELSRRYRYDYAHFQYVAPPIKACKTIVTMHDVLFMEFADDFPWAYRQRKYAFKHSVRNADIVTTCSDYSRQAIIRFFGIDDRKVNVVRPALQNRFLTKPSEMVVRRAKENVGRMYGLGRYILYVSRIEPRKNHDCLLQAYLDLELWKRGIQLVFVGRTAIRNRRLDRLLRSVGTGIAEHVVQIEDTPQDRLMDLLCAADLFVYPTRAEGFGFPPLEAAALGVETVLADATALSEFRFFGDRFFDPYDLESLKEKMSAAMERPETLKPMSKVKEAIDRNFSWRRSAEKLERLIMDDYAHR